MLGQNVPVYETPSCGYSVVELLNMLMQETPPSKLCTKKPCGVRAFASFVVDLKCVELKDLGADDNGVWVTSSPRRKYLIDQRGGNIVSVKHINKVTKDMDKSQIVTICRQYGTHQATPEFKRIITTVVRNGVILPKAVVQYFFKDGVKVPVVVRSHGN